MKNNLTLDERMMILLYSPGTKSGLVLKLHEIQQCLTPEETELMALTQRVLTKVAAMTDEEFQTLDLMPDSKEQSTYTDEFVYDRMKGTNNDENVV